MLVLSRKDGERLKIGDEIWVTVLRCGNGKVRLGIEAPEDVIVLRGELCSEDGESAKTQERFATQTTQN